MFRRMTRNVLLAVCIAAIAVVVVLNLERFSGHRAGGTTPVNFRDPAQLAAAVKASEADKFGKTAAGANCGKLPTGNYVCVLAFSDGTSATCTVTVSADGKSWSAS